MAEPVVGRGPRRNVMLRVFVVVAGERSDCVVALPGETPVAAVREAVDDEMVRRLGTTSFRVTGVNLYPHWNREAE